MKEDLAVKFIGRDAGHDHPLRVLIFAAHPDDADFKAGGTAALYGRAGHVVKIVSVTNGDAGHPEMGGVTLAKVRRGEAADAGKILAAEYITWDNHDSVLLPTLEVRHQIVRLIREFEPDLVMTHRPNDYHPDHRYTSLLVQDAMGVLCVPNIVSDVPNRRYSPVVVYMWDEFQKPYPFVPDVVVDIDETMDAKVDALHCHKSQIYELFPYNKAFLDEVPEGDHERREWLQRWYSPRDRRVADLCRDALIRNYGKTRGKAVKFAEAFERCEYGAALSEEMVPVLFPFYPDQEN